MIIELGHFALILAFVIAIGQSILPLVGAQLRWRPGMAMAYPAALLQVALVGFSFLALTWAFVVSDFSVNLVIANSHSAKPMIYKISGVWGNHEGSMLLWVLILTIFGAAAAVFGGNLPQTLQARVLGVQATVSVAFYAFILFTSNPFERASFIPLNGQDLNPLLQDPGLAFHPPFLYLGYVGLSMAYSFAIAALLEGRIDAAWGRWVRPWTLAAWVFLTIGIALGSWWAYYELGWGGFWFWDPVENASFMPWLLAAALLHCSIVVEKRETLKSWTVLLAILAFGFSILGTFIVRSGVLTSVHAFANDPERGFFILIILAIFLGGGLFLYAARASLMEAKGVFGLVSRESALVTNNILLAVACFVVFVGTIWPLFAELILERTLSVGPPFFNATFTPFMILIGLILPIGAHLAWKRGNLTRTFKHMIPGIVLALAAILLAFAVSSDRSSLGPLGMGLGVWIVFGSFYDLWLRSGRDNDIRVKARRMVNLPRADWGKAFAHGGLGITFIGVAGMLAWEIEDIRVAQIGEPYNVGAYEVTLLDVRDETGPNYETTLASISLKRGGDEIVLTPEKRYYPVAGMPTTEADIRNGVWRDLYMVIGDAQQGGGWAVRTYIKPFANWIWGGAILMSLGGFLSLLDRRMRVAAGAARAKPAEVAAQ